jgi:tight adherence protein C
MAADQAILCTSFLAASSLMFLVVLLVGGRKSRLDSRLEDLAGKGDSVAAPDTVAQFARAALPKMATPLIPNDEKDRTRLAARLIHAGLYGRQAMPLFLGVKMLLMVAPAVLGLVAGSAGLLPVRFGVLIGALLSVVGMVGPSAWLDRRKAKRQSCFRRALPDALDVLVICLEGGLSLPGALRRVVGELRTAHPHLAAELNIVQREIQLGRSTGKALRQFAYRADLEEIRSLASVVIQSERFGASLVKALRVHAETLRQKRMHYAEEMAQKASTKMLFPTILLIFPGVFIVILGPAAIQIMSMLARLRQ